MGRIYCLIGRSSAGKDSIFAELLDKHSERLNLKKLVWYTTRPKRDGEINGVHYNFIDNTEQFKKLFDYENCENMVVYKKYTTVNGIWTYMLLDDQQFTDSSKNYITIAPISDYVSIKDYFERADSKDRDYEVIPIYIEVPEGELLKRALGRELKQNNPNYKEMCRRFLKDSEDFSEEELKTAGIDRVFHNNNLHDCVEEICEFIASA